MKKRKITAKVPVKDETPAEASYSLNQQGISFAVFGKRFIEDGAMHQMYQAAKLPVSVAAALMPDAHSGYGLPIGGVLATDNAVIPYGVGVDIGCRMCLSIYPESSRVLKQKERFFRRTLEESTRFGSSAQFQRPADHAVMDHPLFFSLPLLRKMHTRAWKQLGSSGSGNHFAEFGEVTIDAADSVLGVPPGNYLALLTHSGSRALGAYIANHYTRIAISKRRLPQEVKQLAWLSLQEAEGVEYWAAMNLAGDYAAACHQVIHDKITRALGVRPLRRVENHHNFAWKEQVDGAERIVHRKGATPAGESVLGVVPGSMCTPGYIVKGKGMAASVQSASHGAGRLMSRRQANESITQKQLRQTLEAAGVSLIGGGVDEAPMAYKDIDTVMSAQTDLVDVVGRFRPRIVRMD
ncbi:MAG: RtcB family protein [Flavihumibacter sp.]